VLTFALAEWGTERYVSDHSRIASSAIEIAIVLVATFAFRPLHQRVDGAIEAAFTRKRRAMQQALQHLKRELATFNDTNQLLRRLIEAVDQHADASASAVYLRRDAFRPEASSFDLPAKHVDLDDPLVVRLRSASSPANPRLLESAAAGTIAFPMTAAGELVGFLSVEKRRGEYEQDECHELEMLVEAAAYALLALEPHLHTHPHRCQGNLPAAIAQFIGRDK
jgi:hypothetical protein